MICGAHVALLGLAFAVAAPRPVSAGSPDQVQALVERAVSHIRDVGKEQAFADFNRPGGGFVNGDLSIFCSDVSGINLANGGNPKLVGRDLSAVRDAEGKPTNAQLHRIAQANGKGWYEYPWPNPANGHVDIKVAFVVQVDGRTICGSGYYKPDPLKTERTTAGKSITDHLTADKP